MEDAELAKRLDASLTVAGYGRAADGRLTLETRKTYARVWRDAREWRRSMSLLAVDNPWSSETLAQYAVMMLERGYAKATVDTYMAAVKAGHRQRGWPVPDGLAAWYVLRGANHTAPDSGKVNSLPPRRGVLAAVAEELDARSNQGARDLCLVALGWDTHSKVTELLGVDIGDVAPLPDGLGLRVTVGGRALKVEHTHDPVDVCPVEATLGWLWCLRVAGATSGPLFRAVDKGGNISGCGPHAGPRSQVDDRLHYSAVRRIWARLVARAGLPPESRVKDLRMASAREAARQGVPVPEIADRGGWGRTNGTVLAMLFAAAEEAAE